MSEEDLKLYKVTEKYTTMPLSNPTYVFARSIEEAKAAIVARLHVLFPTYRTELLSVTHIADMYEVILPKEWRTD